MNTYRHYFNIDPEYFPAVNPDVIRHNPNLWKKFYPHPSFVRLLKDTVAVLSRKQKLNIWVDGAYGTGKSHAVLTLQHLLEASEDETKDYFDEFKLDSDLCKQFTSVKSQGQILTVHRYGSSSINGDNDLFLTIQESISEALKDVGIDDASGMLALKDAVIEYLSDEENKASFSVFVKGSYRELFNGDNVDTIIQDLSTYKDNALLDLMGKIFKVANEKQIRAFSLDSKGLGNWIKQIISANKLKAIVFIWDEFTEYFNSNAHHLTGFQELLELSETTPVCFILVVHKDPKQLDGLSNDDRKKIIDRFCKPTCEIELPDNTAFQLMGAAMQKSDDQTIRDEWDDEILPDLCERTTDSRKVVRDFANITDDELKAILPIHPYSAALLKQISSFFESNQRSMFDFIKNDRGDDIKGFQWFIDNYGPEDDDNPFLTVDMLWSFFYDMGKDGLSQDIRNVLDYYPRLEKNGNMDKDEKEELKAVLLFQAISKSANDNVEIYKPNVKNLTLAFEGSESLGNGRSVQCAEKLVRDGILYKKRINNNDEIYSVLTGTMDSSQIEKKKGEFENVSTSNLIEQGDLKQCFEMPRKLSLRYNVTYTSYSELEKNINKTNEKSVEDPNHIFAVVTFARTSNEMANITKKIQQHLAKNPQSEIVFIDFSRNTLPDDKFQEWVTDKATSAYYQGTDNDQAEEYAGYANRILSDWRNDISKGGCVLYDSTHLTGLNVVSGESLNDELFSIDIKRFSCGLEHYNVIDSMWLSTMLKLGAECGVTEQTKNQYKGNQNANLENALNRAWGVTDYWKKYPSEIISKIKVYVNGIVNKALETNGRISIKDIYDDLKQPPYGFLPCNLTAFIIGFVMKEYVNSGELSWSDEIQSTELTVDKFREMVDEVIKLDITPNSRYINKFIVAMTPEEKAFINTTSTAFRIDKSQCSSIETTRERIRFNMKNLSFPIWSLLYFSDSKEGQELVSKLSTPVENLKKVIGLYYDIANNDSSQSGRSDNDIANEIGKISLKKPCLATDLKVIITSENSQHGMVQYLSGYKGGELPRLADKVNDSGQYINAVKDKFDADAANWVWKKETADEKIDEVITEYGIAEATSEWFGSTCKNYSEAVLKIKERCNSLRIPFSLVKNDVGDLEHFLDMLYHLVKEGCIPDSQKPALLEDIKVYGKSFVDFLSQQIAYFKKGSFTYLSGLSDNDISELFKNLPRGSFTMDQPEYFQNLEKEVATFKQKQSSIQMKNLWKEKTDTESPSAWSAQNQIPILLMIEPNIYDEGSKAFAVINRHNPDTNSIDKAIKFMKNVGEEFWSGLNDEAKKDKAFCEKLLGDKAVVLVRNGHEAEDIAALKKYLSSHITSSPYNWDRDPMFRDVINGLAQKEYATQGYQEAFRKIDTMNAEDVKNYLKSLIKNNMNVGIEIIKDN